MENTDSFEGGQFYDVQEAVSSKKGTMMTNSTFDRDELEKCGRWLVSIPRDDVMALRKTPEYNDFLKAFDKLGKAHRQVLLAATNTAERSMQLENGQHSFLQHMAVDDVVLRVMEFLECRSLIQASTTCSRFHDLTHKSAVQRTHQFGKERQLDHIFKLLRAKEEIDGCSTIDDCHVPVPMLGLSKRILVTESSDPEYNGIYHCTGCDSNGYVFTKPRNSQIRRAPAKPRSFITMPFTLEELEEPGSSLNDLSQPHSSDFNDVPRPGELLRCIINKKFSSQTIFWYMCKEVETPVAESTFGETKVTQQYNFWAKLMACDEATADLSQYPSQTGILMQQNGHGWQALTDTELTNPPTVELID